MKIVIIEDEDLAVEGLMRLIKKVIPDVDLVGSFDSIKTATTFFKENEAPDIAFFDIQLADGLSFEIFEQVDVTCPVIFTTAFDEYALRAFRVNSIDYLLKPVELDDLKRAIEKLNTLQNTGKSEAPTPFFNQDLIKQVMAMATQQVTTPQYKSRFMIKIGDNLQSVAVEDVDLFMGENKIVWIFHKNGRKYVVDYTLDQIEDVLDPSLFFRLNRQFIAAARCIKTAIVYSNSRLKIVLHTPPSKEDIIMSREKVEAFKQWLGK